MFIVNHPPNAFIAKKQIISNHSLNVINHPIANLPISRITVLARVPG